MHGCETSTGTEKSGKFENGRGFHVTALAGRRARLSSCRPYCQCIKSAAAQMAHKPIKKFGVQAEKARVITVFRNGDKHHAGEQITMNMKKFKTYDQACRTPSWATFSAHPASAQSGNVSSGEGLYGTYSHCAHSAWAAAQIHG